MSVHDEVLTSIFGDGAWEISKSMSEKNRKRLQSAAFAGNALSTVAGPAAVYSAVKNRKEGGIPRDIGAGIGPKLAGSKRASFRKLGNNINRGVNALNAPGNRKAKLAAGAAGAGMVGLQVVNTGVDGLSAALLKQKKPQKVSKGLLTPMKKAIKGAYAPNPRVTDADLARRASYKAKKAQQAKENTHKWVKASAVATVVGAPTGAYYGSKRGVQQVTKSDQEKLKFRLVRVGVSAGAEGAKQAPKVAKKGKQAVDLAIKGEVSKMDTEKKQVFGWASIIEMNGEPVIDLQGDVMTIETIEKAAYDYVHGSRKGGRQHTRNGEEPLHVSDMIESFVLTQDKKEKMGIPDSVPTGWWVGFQVNDEDTWRQYKDGKLKDFSLHGTGTRTEIEI